MRREEILLSGAIERTINEANTAIQRLYEAQLNATAESATDPDNHEQQDAQDNLSFYVEKVFLDSALLAERLGAPQYAALIERERTEAKGKFSDNHHTEHDVLPHVPHLARARRHFQSLRVMTDAATTTAHDVLETMLKNTAKVVALQNVQPTNEAKVRNAMLEVLRVAFEDARKEVPIPQLFKTYRADIGIPSLRVAIEYKYVKTAQDMKACLDGIYADMKGYSGDDAWRTFYAVFYMAGPFYRQDEVEREFALVGADLNWKPIVVIDQGTAAVATAAAG